MGQLAAMSVFAGRVARPRFALALSRRLPSHAHPPDHRESYTTTKSYKKQIALPPTTVLPSLLPFSSFIDNYFISIRA